MRAAPLACALTIASAWAALPPQVAQAQTQGVVSSGGKLRLPPSPDKALKEIEAAEDALAALWARGPYTVRRAVFITDKPTAYGNYEPRPTNVFAPGEPIITYLEPIGYDWRRQGDRYAIGMSIDLEIVTKDGKIVGGQKAFQRFDFVSRYRMRELYATVTLTLTGSDPGDHTVIYTLNDEASGRSYKVEQPFTIAR